MRLRSFAMYFWSITMFILAAFGTFYMVTGQNILTGQNKNQVNVLPAYTENADEVQDKDASKDTENKDESNQDLLTFNEVMSKTSSDSSYKLTPSDDSDKSVIFLRFGKDDNSYYIATYGSGLDLEQTYSVWLQNDEDTYKLGTLKKVDDTEVLKLGVVLKEDPSIYTKVILALKDADSIDELDFVQEADIELDFDSTTQSSTDVQNTDEGDNTESPNSANEQP